MKNTLQVKKMLKFEDDTKKIFLQGQRMILMGSDALGRLRKDLIAALGIDRAKGFLLRYGWNCGQDYAIHLKELFPDSDILSWMQFGPEIHEMTGKVLVNSIEIIYEAETEDYYAEGYWLHSYEAEEHLKHFGVHHEPVCFTLVGYAGGYISSHVGEKVIVKEVECVGKGDPHCRYIAKKVSDWGKEISDEETFYQEENLAQELDRAYLRIENQNEMFKKVLHINEKLSKALLHRQGLLTIIDTVANSLKTTVIIEDKNFHLMEVSGPYKNHEFQRFIKNTDGSQKSFIDKLVNKKSTVHLSIPEQFGWAHERLITPIIIKRETLGYISFIKEQQEEFNEMEVITIERTSTICALHLLNEKVAVETEQRIKGEFLDELLNGNPNVDNLTYRMNVMGYNLNQPHYIFLFNLEHSNDFRQSDWEAYIIEVKKKMEASIYTKIKSLEQGCLVVSKLDQIIALIPEETLEKINVDVKSFGHSLVAGLQKKYVNIKVTLGISTLCSQIKAYKKGYDEAKKAIDIAKATNRNHKVISFGDLGLISKICGSTDVEVIKQFSLETLHVLMIHDRQHHSEFIKTLYHYLESQGNILKTSRSLKMSAGSIKYRLKRIQEISKLDLSLPSDFFDAHVALQILFFLGEIDLD